MKLDDIKKKTVSEAGPAKKDVPAFLRKKQGGDWKTSTSDLEKEKDDKISDPKTLAKNNGTKKVAEATGDPAFDGMMGKISGSTEPQSMTGTAAGRVQSKAENPDRETIEALNKMMYDMHVTMQNANALMKRLTQG